MQAKAKAFEGTVRLFQRAESLGVAVFFISGRTEQQRAATARNLKAQGIRHWQRMYLRQPSQLHMKATEFKTSARKQIVTAGYTIVVNVGDQMSDFTGDAQADVSVKLSNPFYYVP